jgi:hypothetical protein
MITDSQTNTLYLADCLPTKHPKFFADFEAVLKKCGIAFQLLPDTKDIWAVDYMPVQVSLDKFVQFVYNPDYLQSQKWIKTISDVESICNSIKLNRIKSDIVLDGGNVTKTTDKVIMCDKIFIENPHYSRRQLADKLRELFEVDIDDVKTVEYIRNTLPQELKEKYTDDILYYIIDVINDFFTSSGVLDQEPDEDGYIEIDNDELVEYIIEEAKNDNVGDFPADEIILIVNAEGEYVDLSGEYNLL